VTELLGPVALGTRTARNRIVFGPHETNLARRRSISERHVAYYRRRAAGGVGTIVVEEASVHPSDWPYERCPLATESVEGWAGVAAACQDEGTVVLAGLGHAGGQGSSAYSQAPLWAPSRVPEVATREVPKSMEPEDIEAVIEGFAAAAALAVAAGLHGVEVNAGQHSLLRQFLSALTNQRDDEWGEDRSLLVRRVLVAVRTRAPDAVIGLRLSCDELAPWAGIVPEAGAALAAAVSPLCDYLTVVRGSIFTVGATRPGTQVEPGFNRELTALVRGAVRAGARPVPVVAQGSIVRPALAASMVDDEVADLVEMTRAQIADPDLAAKAGRGDDTRIRPCIRCNQWCQVRDARNPIVGCVGEPASGHEWETEWAPAGPPASAPDPPSGRAPVLVVGAGPAGLECARSAAVAGHPVTVVERRSSTGGAVRVAARADGRGALAELVAWLEAECRTLGVHIRTDEEVRPDAVDAQRGAVVLCTGSVPGELHGVRGAPGALTVLDAGTLLETLDEAWPEGTGPASAAVVWDPLGGPVGVSVAETLAGRGAVVTLVTPDPVVGQELARSGDLAPANVRLHGAGVALRTSTHLRAVGPDWVGLEHRFTGVTERIDAALVVDAGPRQPDDTFLGGLRAGDAVAPRGVGEAVLEGRRAALALESAGVR
jgi:mycofactocin system FadH/OYE family oxidoreductase 1